MKFAYSQAAWIRLLEHAKRIKHTHLRTLFEQDPERAKRFSLKVGGIRADFSKNWIDDTIFHDLIQLAKEMDTTEHIQAMWRGDKINQTEKRAVLHTALRANENNPLWLDGENIRPKIRAEWQKMADFAQKVRSGAWRGYTGKPIQHIVNIGIGGSDLGPLCVAHALKEYAAPHLNIHFVSNADSTQLHDVLQTINRENTLFIVVSKTFTTQETLANAQSAKTWFLQTATEEDVAQHFIAVSTNTTEAQQFGIHPNNIFTFWDWVGGRFSLWSAVGLSLMLYLGEDVFAELLAGAEEMDTHFYHAPLERNLPVILAMLGVWYINFHHLSHHILAPYAQRLEYLPRWLTQLDMESNGKRVRADGKALGLNTAPAVFGEIGINAQHAFFQLLHQGTHIMPVDFIVSLDKQTHFNEYHEDEHHEIVLSNAFAQAEALMKGKTPEEVAIEMRADGINAEQIALLLPHRVFSGNRPSNMLALESIDPRNLGNLLALYEHKIFVQGIIWGINSFDQWGVELGKKLAKSILPELHDECLLGQHDSSTQQLIRWYHEVNGE